MCCLLSRCLVAVCLANYGVVVHSVTETFFCTRAVQTFSVPQWVTSISVDVVGAGGGEGESGLSKVPGKGARVQTVLTVFPGEMLYISVGEKGGGSLRTNIESLVWRPGGFGGGGDGYGAGTGGGGASDIRRGGGALQNRIVVAGGGGGLFLNNDAGNGGNGGFIGGSAYSQNCPPHFSGKGGTQNAGGLAVNPSNCPVAAAEAGSFGQGGDACSNDAGGGGGGYWGGSGGADGCGGGGGSSYSITPSAIVTSGHNSDDGFIVIEYAAETINTQVFFCTGAPQTYIVPGWVYSLNIDLIGAASGFTEEPTTHIQGRGARVVTTMAVTPGETLRIYIGGQGDNSKAARENTGFAAFGGFNGGGNGIDAGTAGGGASDIRQGGDTLDNRVVVAGGGGGLYLGPNCGTGQYGGHAAEFGFSGVSCVAHGGVGGGGGSSESGGAAGSGVTCSIGLVGGGTKGFGGNGCPDHGAGGGGGYYGGGGGGRASGGGGGSSYSVTPGAVFTTGFSTGNGSLVISYSASNHPTSYPSSRPSRQPTGSPSVQPNAEPSAQPTTQPTVQPSTQPLGLPSSCPSSQPSHVPSVQPIGRPTGQPTTQPTSVPTRQPTRQPLVSPSAQPSVSPSTPPSSEPTRLPSVQPTGSPSSQPVELPSSQPSAFPSIPPSGTPSSHPIANPSNQPSGEPSRQPLASPSSQPTTCPTNRPTETPSSQPTAQPVGRPTSQPSILPSGQPSGRPSDQPSSMPSVSPSTQPSSVPTGHPSSQPSGCPSRQPSSLPSLNPSAQPSSQPTVRPSAQPSYQPTGRPSVQPSYQQTSQPTVRPSGQPSVTPSSSPTYQPVSLPSNPPSSVPTVSPSLQPSSRQTAHPSGPPSSYPSTSPSSQPTATPSNQPSTIPSDQPTATPSRQPNSNPSGQPSVNPSMAPSEQPSASPSGMPTSQPQGNPTSILSAYPSDQLTSHPTTQPSSHPSIYRSVGTLPSNSNGISTRGIMDSNSKITLPFMFVSYVGGNGFYDVVAPLATNSSTSYVIYGSATIPSSDMSLASSGHLKSTVNNLLSYDFSGRSVANAGDINGDGYDDLIIGAPYASRVYVLFGTGNGFVNMTTGFTVFGVKTTDLTGWSVSSARDVNNDTFADIVIGAPLHASGAGAAYVLFGKLKGAADIYLSDLQSEDGFALVGHSIGFNVGVSVSGAGDVNSDGNDDVIIGALNSNAFYEGRAIVLFGGESTKLATISTSGLTSYRGLLIMGEKYSWFGFSVSGAGDVNNDTFSDIIVGSIPYKNNMRTEVTHILYGGSNVTAVDWRTSRIILHGGGVYVSAVGDLDRDGFDDVFVGAGYDLSTGGGFFVRIPKNNSARTFAPTLPPTMLPSVFPSKAPTHKPSVTPTQPTVVPTETPSGPTHSPTMTPTQPTSLPSATPTAPTQCPTVSPTILPTFYPTQTPTRVPSTMPSTEPTMKPSIQATATPTVVLTMSPSQKPATNTPTRQPFLRPTVHVAPVYKSHSEVWLIGNHTEYIRNNSEPVTVFVNTTDNAYISGRSSGSVHITIIPTTPCYLYIEWFNVTSDVIDLTHFNWIPSVSDLTFSEPLTIHLSSNQTVVIANITSSGSVRDIQFLFATPFDSSKANDNGGDDGTRSYSPAFFVALVFDVILVVILYKSAVSQYESYLITRRRAKIEPLSWEERRKGNRTFLTFLHQDSLNSFDIDSSSSNSSDSGSSGSSDGGVSSDFVVNSNSNDEEDKDDVSSVPSPELSESKSSVGEGDGMLLEQFNSHYSAHEYVNSNVNYEYSPPQHNWDNTTNNILPGDYRNNHIDHTNDHYAPYERMFAYDHYNEVVNEQSDNNTWQNDPDIGTGICRDNKNNYNKSSEIEGDYNQFEGGADIDSDQLSEFTVDEEEGEGSR